MELYAVYVTYTFAFVKHELIGVFDTPELAKACGDNLKAVMSYGTITDIPQIEIQSIELNQSFPPAKTPMSQGLKW